MESFTKIFFRSFDNFCFIVFFFTATPFVERKQYFAQHDKVKMCKGRQGCRPDFWINHSKKFKIIF